MNDTISAWDKLSELLIEGNSTELNDFIDTLSPSETARAISRLSDNEQARLLRFTKSGRCC